MEQLEKIVTWGKKTNRIMWSQLDEQERLNAQDDLVECYLTNYPGVTRQELIRRNKGMYDRMYMEGLINHVPKLPEKDESYKLNHQSELIEFYHTVYPTITRGQLQKINQAFYQKLWEEKISPDLQEQFGKKLIELIPKRKSRQQERKTEDTMSNYKRPVLTVETYTPTPLARALTKWYTA